MVAGLARSELQTSYKAGVGKVREHTLVLGGQVIALDNIGSIRFFESARSWWLAFVGLVIIGGGGSQVPLYGPFAWAGVGIGIVLVLINMLVPIERGVSIGITDGRTAMIMSKDAAFLRRLLDLLTEKINSRNEALIASFDISTGAIHANEHSPVLASPPLQRAPIAAVPARDNNIAVASSDPAATSIAGGADIDEALFASEPEPTRSPPAVPERTATASVQRMAPHDPMLDGPSIAPPRPQGDWLNAPGGFAYEGDQTVRPGPMRWMLPALLLAILAGGAVAAWMVLRNPDGALSISLMTPAATSPAESITLADALAETAAPALNEAPAEPAAALDPAAFIPPEPIVARASGQRYRAQPSSTEEVPVLAETRFGGEALLINGHVFQSDGEWYRVSLPDGRTAWFKASLAIAQARFAETLATSSAAPASFGESSPRILEPAEGAQLSGGRQSIRLAWIGIDSATAYRVEIQSFDSAIQRWTNERQPRHITILGAAELAETFAVGVWRWRVRAVSSDGEQSQLSRWAAFSVRD
ncbi:MAG: DUF6232 family protein [Hyphomonadaceae bacterium]